MDITEFLTARLDEDEKVTRAALGRWSAAWSVDPEEWATGVGVQDGDGHSVAAVHGTYRAEHIARHDPARVLADIAAKRKLLAWHGDDNSDLCVKEHVGYTVEAWYHPPTEPCETLLWLAAPYAGHPDFDKAWSSV